MPLVRLIRYVGLGVAIAAVELFLLNIIPLSGVVDILFLVVLILFFEQRVLAAAVTGIAGTLIRDILSGDAFFVHVAAFITILLFMVVLSEWVFTSNVTSAHIVFGVIQLILYRALDVAYAAFSSSARTFVPMLTSFPSIVWYFLINSALLAVILYIRHRDTRGIKVPWVVAVRR